MFTERVPVDLKIEPEESRQQQASYRTPFAISVSSAGGNSATCNNDQRIGSTEPNFGTNDTQVYENPQEYSRTPIRPAIAFQLRGVLNRKKNRGRVLSYSFNGKSCLCDDDSTLIRKHIKEVTPTNFRPIVFKNTIRKSLVERHHEIQSLLTDPAFDGKKHGHLNGKPRDRTSSRKSCRRNRSQTSDIYLPSLRDSHMARNRKRLKVRSQHTQSSFLECGQLKLTRSFELFKLK